MKYLFTLLLIPFVLFSQTDEMYKCNFIPIPRMYDSTIFSQSVKSNFNDDEPIVINVFFYIIKQQNGDDIWSTTEQDLLKLLANVNREFNTFKIFFKYKGFYNLHSNNYLAEWDIIKGELITLGEYRTNAINVQISPNLTQGNLTTIVWDNNLTDIDMAFRADVLNSPNNLYKKTAIHEFAHAMGLMHIFEGTTGGVDCNATDGVDCLPNDSDCPYGSQTNGGPIRLYKPVYIGNDREENVTRDTNSIYYNATTKGDLVSDTPAQFNGAPHNVCKNLDEDLNTFIEHTDVRDNSDIDADGPGEMYVDIDFRNYMGYYGTGLRTHFTNGQKNHMRDFIKNVLNNDIYDHIENDVESLYESYVGNYYYDGIFLPENIIKFQYGFNYKFVACGTNSFGDIVVYNTPEWSNFSYDITNITINFNDTFIGDVAHFITHPNHTAILIEDLDTTPHKCYNNYNRTASGGSVVHYLDGVPNTNINIDVKTEAEINNTNLIPNLDNGLYIIKKNFNDGSQEQNTILKNEN